MNSVVKEEYENVLQLLRSVMTNDGITDHKKRSVLHAISVSLTKTLSGETGSVTIGYSQGSVTQVENKNVTKTKKE